MDADDIVTLDDPQSHSALDTYTAATKRMVELKEMRQSASEDLHRAKAQFLDILRAKGIKAANVSNGRDGSVFKASTRLRTSSSGGRAKNPSMPKSEILKALAEICASHRIPDDTIANMSLDMDAAVIEHAANKSRARNKNKATENSTEEPASTEDTQAPAESVVIKRVT